MYQKQNGKNLVPIRAKKWGASFCFRTSTSQKRVQISPDREKINRINAVWRPLASKK